MPEPYVELHARSAFSFLQGASAPEDLVCACADLGIPAMALLDRDGVYGAPRFHMAAKKTGMRAHIGSEITCTNGKRYPLTNGMSRLATGGFIGFIASKDDGLWRVVMIETQHWPPCGARFSVQRRTSVCRARNCRLKPTAAR